MTKLEELRRRLNEAPTKQEELAEQLRTTAMKAIYDPAPTDVAEEKAPIDESKAVGATADSIKITGMVDKSAPPRPMGSKMLRRIVIEALPGQGWTYKFEGNFNVHILNKVAKGLKRGWRRHTGAIRRKEGRPVVRKDQQVVIPKERPGENLGDPPFSKITPGIMPTMPLYPGTGISPVSTIVEPDSASLPQPKPSVPEAGDSAPEEQREVENATTG